MPVYSEWHLDKMRKPELTNSGSDAWMLGCWHSTASSGGGARREEASKSTDDRRLCRGETRSAVKFRNSCFYNVATAVGTMRRIASVFVRDADNNSLCSQFVDAKAESRETGGRGATLSRASTGLSSSSPIWDSSHGRHGCG
jgi:hypothetical protein